MGIIYEEPFSDLKILKLGISQHSIYCTPDFLFKPSFIIRLLLSMKFLSPDRVSSNAPGLSERICESVDDF